VSGAAWVELDLFALGLPIFLNPIAELINRAFDKRFRNYSDAIRDIRRK